MGKEIGKKIGKEIMDKENLDGIARVDHAGEYGAVRIYQGQSAIFRQGDQQMAKTIDQMAAHEQAHLDYFKALLVKHQIRPTIFLPLWHVGGFALGAMTALMGRKAAFACTQAVEEVIEEHYTRQIKILGTGNRALKKQLSDFRDDERSHHDIAKQENQDDYSMLRFSVSTLCRVAITLSSRF